MSGGRWSGLLVRWDHCALRQLAVTARLVVQEGSHSASMNGWAKSGSGWFTVCRAITCKAWNCWPRRRLAQAICLDASARMQLCKCVT